MTLRRLTRSVDGTIPVQALLYTDEEIYSSEDNVGIYDGTQKAPNHQAGTIVVTTHRLFYIDSKKSYKYSFSLDLSTITQTEYYAGLFSSSPKVTLHLSLSNTSTAAAAASSEEALDSWECEVCAYRNPPGLSPTAAKVCGLCGVPRSSVPSSKSTSLPTSTAPSPSPPPSSDSNACPTCTFLNHPSLRHCEMCSTPLPRVPAKSAPSSRPPSPDNDDTDDAGVRFIKLSFRKGGDKPFYAVLKRSLKGKIWEASRIASTKDVGRSQGISGILHEVETSAKGQQDGMLDALHDLEALMVKAKDMVRLAAELNDKLTAATAVSSTTTSSSSQVPEPEEATFIRTSLSQLGLQMPGAPVTLDMMKDEKRWAEELARELARVLQGSATFPSQDAGGGGGMMRSRGVIALDEVWGGWNRARGVALLPPSTLLLTLPLLPTYTSPPIALRTFPSGLKVLHTPAYSHASFSARLSGLLALSGPKTGAEVAREEGVTLALAGEMIGDVERGGDVVRDDEACRITGGGGGGGEIWWYANVFVGYRWDGQVY
ncbi:hypothetical protein H0H87_010908 [Tephrocybe sp. NHM501043]|nr:hypothetical protein H0H87_010908 [Tephrocybe sp. NHM501043]